MLEMTTEIGCYLSSERSKHVTGPQVSSATTKRMVTINISGQIHQSYLDTLHKYPETLLGDEHRRGQYYNEACGQYYFDRHGSSFIAILHYYQTGEGVVCPAKVPPDVLLQELIFFDLGDVVIDNFKREYGLTVPFQRHLNGVLSLVETVASCLPSMIAIYSVCLTLALVLAILVYFAEFDHPDTTIRSIPDACWWVVVTISTVGYGDQVPMTLAGRVYAIAASMLGVLTFLTPLPLLCNSFHHIYTRRISRLAFANNSQLSNQNNSDDTETKEEVQNNNGDMIIINISGRKYQTKLSTLTKFPGTLLGDPLRRVTYYDSNTNELFIERDWRGFEAILYYYQSGGTLYCPSHISPVLFRKEIQFYQLGKCALDSFKSSAGLSIQEEGRPPPNGRHRLWTLLEYPDSSPGGRLLAMLSMTVLAVSVASFITSTLPPYVYFRMVPGYEDEYFNVEEEQDTNPSHKFYSVDRVCLCIFVFELIVRLVSCPDKCGFMLDIFNWLDILAITPSLIFLFNHGKTEVLFVLRALRLLRIQRLLRPSKGFLVTRRVISACRLDLFILHLCFWIAVITVSILVYIFEKDVGEEFQNFGSCIWWAVITMTTVGYGDIIPATWWGKLVGSMAALGGIATLTLLITLLVSSFMYHNNRLVVENCTSDDEKEDRDSDEEADIQLVKVEYDKADAKAKGREHIAASPANYKSESDLIAKTIAEDLIKNEESTNAGILKCLHNDDTDDSIQATSLDHLNEDNKGSSNCIANDLPERSKHEKARVSGGEYEVVYENIPRKYDNNIQSMPLPEPPVNTESDTAVNNESDPSINKEPYPPVNKESKLPVNKELNSGKVPKFVDDRPKQIEEPDSIDDRPNQIEQSCENKLIHPKEDNHSSMEHSEETINPPGEGQSSASDDSKSSQIGGIKETVI